MAVLPADARCMDTELLGLQACGPDAWLLDLALPELLPSLAPGRFAMLSPGDGSGPLIPRPFSVYDQPQADRLRFLIQVIGPGTRALSRLSPGSPVVCTAPLGNGFRLVAPDRPVVLLAGGVGSAPFLLYGRQRREQGAGSTALLFGARSADRLYDHASFSDLGMDLLLATEDGSQGFHGNVLQALEQGLDSGRFDPEARFAACGPEGLLHAFSAFARRRGLDAEISLETYMGCGVGVCNGCPVATAEDGCFGAWPYTKTCLEGPVYSVLDLVF
ncbi:MAG: dihydroorotate dehydrogenase electron transfer subunit [Planctomycetota bacterium]|nr:MAG: dihydroorotate dehydrogenase electron transfer subunit [Planctomycetota bacterium]